jgi:hypothetical protein
MGMGRVLNIYRMKMYRDDDKYESYAVVETVEEAARLFVKKFGVNPDFVSKETYTGITLLGESQEDQHE